MKIGLIDVDGHNFPNLALMRISAYHKTQGDDVEWWWSDFVHYDIVYMSKVFSDAYSQDVPEPLNADRIIKGGTGYHISKVDGKEVFNTHTHRFAPGDGAYVPGLLYLSAVSICSCNDISRMLSRLSVLPCQRKRG